MTLDGADGATSRRNVLKGSVAVGAFIALDAIGGVALAAGGAPKQTPVASGVIYPDPSLCIGCLTCEVICSRVHKEVGLSDIPRIRIFNDPQVKVDPAVQQAYPDRGSFHQEPCLQCPTAECLYVCPVNAVRVEPTSGARIIREDVCVSCNRCAEACPFPVSGEQNATRPACLGTAPLACSSARSTSAFAREFCRATACAWTRPLPTRRPGTSCGRSRRSKGVRLKVGHEAAAADRRGCLAARWVTTELGLVLGQPA